MLQLKYFLKFIGADYEVCVISFGKIREEVPPLSPTPRHCCLGPPFWNAFYPLKYMFLKRFLDSG